MTFSLPDPSTSGTGVQAGMDVAAVRARRTAAIWDVQLDAIEHGHEVERDVDDETGEPFAYCVECDISGPDKPNWLCPRLRFAGEVRELRAALDRVLALCVEWDATGTLTVLYESPPEMAEVVRAAITGSTS